MRKARLQVSFSNDEVVLERANWAPSPPQSAVCSLKPRLKMERPSRRLGFRCVVLDKVLSHLNSPSYMSPDTTLTLHYSR